MKTLIALPLLLCAGMQAQVLSSAEQKNLLDRTRPLYYSPVARGMLGFSCLVKFDLDSLRKLDETVNSAADPKVVEETKVVVSVLKRSPTEMNYELPRTVPASDRAGYDQLFKTAKGLLTSLLDAWASKAMEGPLPDDQGVRSVQKTQLGYELKLAVSGQESTLTLDRELKAKRYQAPDLDETLTYTASPQGLLLTEEQSELGSGRAATHLKINVAYQSSGGFQIPQRLELQMNQSPPATFNLEQCTAPRAN